MQRTVLVTGATGFIGSAVALALLKRGCRIASLERPSEPGGPVGGRTLAQIEIAAEGFGVTLDDGDRSRVVGLPYDIARLREETSSRRTLGEVDSVWHCAAEMTFSPERFDESFSFNVGKTVELYRLFGETAVKPRRFFYVSTAYTSGPDPGPIPEDVHVAPYPCNTYFTTKWAAEMALHACALRDGAVPVTIYRTSSVVGHSETGRYWGNTFALYALVEILAYSAHKNNPVLHMSFDPGASHWYVPIDDITQNAAALICDVTEDRQCSVVHDIGTDWSDGAITKAIDDIFGVKTHWGDPVTEVDKKVDAKIEKYRPLHNHTTPRPFRFASERLRELLGSSFAHHPIDDTMMKKLATTHLMSLMARAMKKS